MQSLWNRCLAVDQKHRALWQWGVVLAAAGAFLLVGTFFAPQMLLMYSADWPERRTWLLLFGALYVAVMAYVIHGKKYDAPRFLYVAVLMMVALTIRLAMMNHITADYASFLRDWVDIFKAEGFVAITKEIGDYNLPYQYLLAIIAEIPLNVLYQIKLVSVVFDFALALLLLNMTERFLHKRYGLVMLTCVLLLPTLWFNGAFWAQCDVIYVFFVVACLYNMLADRPVLSVVMLTIAFSFKIQTIFFFPMVLFGLLQKKYKLRHALVFPATYMVLMLPALVMGRSLISALTIYLHQAGQYGERLTWNAANIYQFMPFGEVSAQHDYRPILQYMPWMNPKLFEGALANPEIWSEWWTEQTVRTLNSALVPYAGMLVLALVFYLFNNRKYIQLAHVWLLSLAFTLLLPLILPKMHDRYFILAEIFAVLYAVRVPKRWFVPVLVTGASFISYMPFLAFERPVDMRIAAAMMTAAMGVVLWDVIRTYRQARLADPERAAEMNEPYAV